jgi:hypothetical protein
MRELAFKLSGALAITKPSPSGNQHFFIVIAITKKK